MGVVSQIKGTCTDKWHYGMEEGFVILAAVLTNH